MTGLVLDVAPYRQSPGYCSAASLKIVLAYFGYEVSEKEAAKRIGCTRQSGGSARGIAAAARSFGFKAVYRRNSTISDIAGWLSMDVPPIVDFFPNHDGHYAVIKGIKDGRIRIQDPELGSEQDYKIGEFRQIWFDYKGRFPKSGEFIAGMLIAVYKPLEELVQSSYSGKDLSTISVELKHPLS